MTARLAALLLLTALAAVPAWAQRAAIPPRPPASEGLVIDRAGVLSAAERQALNQKLIAYDDTTSTQIVVVTVPTLGGADAATFATELGQAWGVGQGGKDNGVVVLVAPNDRQVFIATGFGLEGAIPDAIAGRIVRNVMLPAFRQGRFYAGIDAATDALMAAAAGEYEAERRAPGSEGDGFDLALFVIVLIILIFLVSGARKGGRGGGGRPYRRRRSGMPPVIIFPGSFGGGHRGGGGFGGFGGGGGFGGFGGGGFGGGGAGGSW